MDKKGKGGLEEIRKDLKIIKEAQKRLLDCVDKGMIERSVESERALKYLSSLSFSVSSISKFHDDNGNVRLIVNYGKPCGEIIVGQDGVYWDAFSEAMNELNLIPYEDMMKIGEAIENELNELNK